MDFCLESVLPELSNLVDRLPELYLVERLSWGLKIAYGGGEMANAIKVVTFALYGLFFATVVKGLPGTWVGIVAFAATLWDALLDPYVGYLTDGPRSFSKRYSSMLAGASTMGLGLWAFFSPPHNLSMVMLFVWLLAASFLLRSAASVFTIPYYAIGARLCQDYQERTSITGIRNIGTGVGTLLASALSAVVFFPDKVPGVDPKLDPKAYSTMGLTFGAMMTLAALVAVWSTRSLRRRLETESAETPSVSRQSPGVFFVAMRESLRIPSFRVILISFSLVIVGLAVNGALLIHFLEYYAGVNGSLALGSSQAVYCTAGLLGTLFWLRISDRFDKHLLYVFSAASTAALMLGAQLLFGKGHLLGTGNVRPLLIGYGLAGFFGCMLWFLPPSMMADVADECDLTTGTRPEGALFGVLSFFKQVATGVAILLAGGLLQGFVKLAPGKLQQSALTASRIGMAYSLVPAALVMMSALIMLRYRLTRSRVASIQAQLDHRSSAIAELQGVD
jgi:GPH family glycoside/pentoside/hexuronide:cation symporter